MTGSKPISFSRRTSSASSDGWVKVEKGPESTDFHPDENKPSSYSTIQPRQRSSSVAEESSSNLDLEISRSSMKILELEEKRSIFIKEKGVFPQDDQTFLEYKPHDYFIKTEARGYGLWEFAYYPPRHEKEGSPVTWLYFKETYKIDAEELESILKKKFHKNDARLEKIDKEIQDAREHRESLLSRKSPSLESCNFLPDEDFESRQKRLDR